MTLSVLLFASFQLVNLASCEPTVNFPLNSQLPPVARVDKLFSYTFSPYTFKSTSESKISYSLGDAPKWVSIDGEDGRLYGTPTDKTIPSGDIIGQTVEIIANDGSGSTTMNSTLVISRKTGPSILKPLADQIKNFGDYSAPSSLLFYASKEFSFSFDSDTFDYQANMINFYASSNDSSPLPSWLQFAPDSLTFSGKTPPIESLIQPPQTFDFKLIASDIVGFSAVSIPFSIIVGSHKLSSDNPTIMLNATRGKKLTYDNLLEDVKLDNKPVKSSQVNVSTEDMPPWLSLNNETWKIEGTPRKKEDHSTNFTINFHDTYSDSLAVEVTVNVATALFRSTLDDINIRAGERVNIDLESYLWDPSDVTVNMTLSPAKDWLNTDGLNITGKIPTSATGKLKISLTASSKSSTLEETQTFNAKILAATATTSVTKTSTSTISTTTDSSESTSPALAEETESRDGVSLRTILLATLLPVLILGFILILVVCCIIRRRRAQGGYLSSSFRNKISGPVLESLRVNGTNPAMKENGAVTSQTNLHHPVRGDYTEVDSFITPPSSPVINVLATPEVPARFTAEDSSQRMASATSRPATATATDGRQSWYTVGTITATATARRSEASMRSHRSDTTFSEATHELLPPPAFLSESDNSFRSGIDLAIPSLEDLPNMRQSDLNTMRVELANPRDPSAFYSSAPDSSLEFNSSHQSSPRLMTGLFSKKTSVVSLAKRPVTSDGVRHLGDGVHRVPAMRRPSQVRMSDGHWLRQQSIQTPWSEGEPNVNKSFRTEPSFGSSENWRVIGSGRGNSSISYRELVETAPFHPARSSTALSGIRDGARPGERASSPELMSPSQWGDAKTSVRGSMTSLREGLTKSISRRSQLSVEVVTGTGSRYSKLADMPTTPWRREPSPTKSEAGSFKAFI
ncbi:hypothetical protein B0T10DRAFT_311467 [Thelonectria olida]|uniref:Dystroglycan-type cadherin-like domain-containing protein n=1 Tax=Thelonectria olida TaxID=1576542 RepID=A0A9P8WA74_9HYPO|nr:hypothetical protein B0T10DRAFT_311467 [Thelonectria olida]